MINADAARDAQTPSKYEFSGLLNPTVGRLDCFGKNKTAGAITAPAVLSA
jgi:hypothetical protein